MRTDRLKYLAREILPYVKPEKFDMGIWKCRTAACAFGYMCVSPRGQRDGLSLSAFREPKYKGYMEFKAAVVYFEIDSELASWLFTEQYDNGGSPDEPVDVAVRIETLLATEDL